MMKNKEPRSTRAAFRGTIQNHTIGQAFCATNLPQAQAFQIRFLSSSLTGRQVYTIFKFPNSERLYKGLSDSLRAGRTLAHSAKSILADCIALAKNIAVSNDPYRRNSRNVRYPRGSAASHWPGSVSSVPSFLFPQTVRLSMSNNNVTPREDLSLAQLAARVEKVLFKLIFLKEATHLLIEDVDNNGGGQAIKDVNLGMGFYFSEMIDELDRLGTKLRYLHSQGETQKADRQAARKEQGAA